MKRRKIKKILSWICVGVLVVSLAVMPLLAKKNEEADGPKASILSGTVGTDTITTAIHGGGTLETLDAVEITIPSGVKITEFLVENGETVSQGDALAAVDRISVMSAITQVQETMDYLVLEMADAADEKVSDKIKAQAGGRIKQIFAREGERVQDVMLRDGALAVLSLDGLMAVKIEKKTNLPTGDSVVVTLSDGTQITGRVESNLNGILVITIKDEGYGVGEAVQVTTEDDEFIGSGELYVHNAWKATGYSGTIQRVNVKEENMVSAGRTLFTLNDTEYMAQFNALAAKHRDYEALMLELFRMYQSKNIPAPCDGVVAGVDKDSIHLLSDNKESWRVTLLANAPNGDDETTYANFVGMVTGVDSGKWNLALNPANLSITDYKELSGVPLDTASMTQVASYVPTVPVYTLSGEEWVQISSSSITVGDILLFAGDSSGNFVWTVLVSHADISPEEPEPTLPSEPTEPTQPSDPTDPSEPENPDDPGKENLPGINGDMDFSGIQIPQGGSFGGFMGGSVQEEEEFPLFDLNGSTLMAITSGEKMKLAITVDQQEISRFFVGQKAVVQVDALRNETFDAVVTEVGTSGTNRGGSSKFIVELTLVRTADMLAGMSARASIPLLTTENIPVIPVAALAENGANTVVYTTYDESTGELGSPVTVTLGVSDGIHVQILSGLELGDSYFYEYYDTLEISTEVESDMFSFD